MLPGVVGAAVLVLGPPPLLLLLADVAPSSSITSNLRMPGAAGVADVVEAAVLVLAPLALRADIEAAVLVRGRLALLANVVEAATLATGQLVLRTDAALAPACRSSSHTMESTHRRRPLVVKLWLYILLSGPRNG